MVEEQIKQKFLKAYNCLMGDKEQVIRDTKIVIKAITNLEEIDKQINETKSELEIVSGLVQKDASMRMWCGSS